MSMCIYTALYIIVDSGVTLMVTIGKSFVSVFSDLLLPRSMGH